MSRCLAEICNSGYEINGNADIKDDRRRTDYKKGTAVQVQLQVQIRAGHSSGVGGSSGVRSAGRSTGGGRNMIGWLSLEHIKHSLPDSDTYH